MTYGAGSAGPHALTSASGPGGTHTWTYDAAGQMQTEKRGTQTQKTFTYYADGRVRTYVAGGATQQYWYDANGKLARKLGGGISTTYIGDIYEKQNSTYPSAALGTGVKYYWLNGERIAVKKGNDLRYLVTDHQSSTALTLSGTAVSTSTFYFPFGDERYTNGTPLTDKLYTGQQRESTGGQTPGVGDVYHYGARMYHTGIGRFLSPDPVIPEPGNRH